MSKEKINPQSPEEIAQATQEAALKAAMEQAQAMFGGIPGFQMPDMGNIQEQINAQMRAAVPNLNEIQAQQAAMGTLGDIDPETVTQAARQNMSYASQTMAAMLNGAFDDGQGDEPSMPDELAGLLDELDDFSDSDWEIRRKDDHGLTDEQAHLLAFGAPLLVYNAEEVDSIESQIDADAFREQLRSWWNITDKASTLEIADWLLNEGHHADADEAFAELRERGLENITDEERDDEESKMGDVCLIVEHMFENEYCANHDLPTTAIAWDLVRLVNLARWARLCGYLSEKEMWQMARVAADTARKTFGSWKEYGLSFAFGRGVWHGDPDDCDTAYEIISTLLEKEESPWKQIEW